MRFLIVLAMLAAVAFANPLINIRVNVDSQDGPPGLPPPPGPGPYPPPPGPGPEQPPPQPYRKDALPSEALPTDTDVVFPVNEPNPPMLVNIEVFVDNQRQGNIPIVPDYPPPQPY
uniref:DUF4794 domain-containing protein n=1 Tax=Anopheles funestus TaxID=62324 RepID=A0A182RN89_ANOFN